VTPDVAVLVPMLGRAHLMGGLRDSLHATCPSAQIVWLATAGDTDVARAARLPDERLLLLPPRRYGDYARKVNYGVQATGSPLLFLGAGDILFRPGWYEACLAALAPGIGVVGTNDLGNPRTADGRLSTHSLVTRDYTERGTVDDPGVLLHEGYWHEYVDDEFIGTAKARGAYAHAPDAHVEHLHPAWGKRPPDRLDHEGARRMAYGRRLFKARRHLWT
jgi:hypothetical protein